jgi:hypothetical protein
MINFPCKCGHPFSLPDDQAGGLIQCPDCHLLADIPTLSDLANMHDDGTFAFEESLVNDTTTAADLHRVFTTKTTNSQGIEKDLRPTLDHFKAIGTQDLAKPRPAPRYDPVTGELIRPLELKDEEPTPVLSMGTLVDPGEIEADDEEPMPVTPVRAQPILPAHSLGYAIGDARKHVTLSTLGLELLMPANAIVIFFIFILYVMAYYTTSAIATYAERFIHVVWPLLLVNVPMWLALAHYGCTIEDIGPDAIDELPRPLRNFSLGEDIIGPLFRILLAGVICFWPAILAYRALDTESPHAVLAMMLLAMAGAYPFPAVLLTAVTGSTILNLRPDRVIAVIRLSAGNYLISVFLFVIAAVPSVYFLAGELLFRLQLTGPVFHLIDTPRLMLPLMILAVYLAHFFCWHLGLMYRANHNRFPWVAQYHVKKNDSTRRRTLAD